MVEGILTIKLTAENSDALFAKARFAVHTTGNQGQLRWGANGNLNAVEEIGPHDHQAETPPVAEPDEEPVAVVADAEGVALPKKTAAKRGKK